MIPSSNSIRALILAAILAQLSISLPSAPAHAQSSTASGLDAELQAIAEKAVSEQGIPGVAVGMLTPDGTLHIHAAGVANIEAGDALRTEEYFAAGSITKTVISALMLKLAEEGKLNLGDSVSDYFPEITYADMMTLRHLLNHTSGIYDYAELAGELPMWMTAILLAGDWKPDEVVEITKMKDPYFPPGAGWHYSNTNYILLGLIIERIEGKPLAEVLHARIFEPYGLENTFFAGHDALPNSRIQGYEYMDGGLHNRTVWDNPTLSWAAGAIVTNTADLLRLGDVLFNSDLISEASRREMRATVPSYFSEHYGLGLMVQQTAAGSVEGHEGMTLAFRSALWHVTADGTIVTVLSNLRNCDMDSIYADLFAISRQH